MLRGLDSEIIDLSIATDPPFNRGVRAFEGATKAGVDVEYKGVWHWVDVQEKWVADIEGNHPWLYNMIRAANSTAGDDNGQPHASVRPVQPIEIQQADLARAVYRARGRGAHEQRLVRRGELEMTNNSTPDTSDETRRTPDAAYALERGHR